MTDQTFNLPE